MNVHLYASPAGFGPVARWVYRRDPVRFTTELTTLRTSPWPADHLLLGASDCGGTVGAALQMRDSTLLVSGLPPTLTKESTSVLASARPDLPGVRGTFDTATAFSRCWVEATGATAELSFSETLYRLGDLCAPVGVTGTPRLADEADADLITSWFDAFFTEAFGAESDPAAHRRALAAVADAGGRVVLWTVNAEPVAMARVHGVLLGMSRIGPVYTPPQHRSRGYGAAVTAEAVRQAWRRGARDVVLFADDANPVSNAIYRRLGFLPVGENVQYAFTA
ncbi:GNAT family N-acetyltransferase [Mycobacterium yunnanensis]|uniref:GNAT family N-acetyltransferase n=1 Tax=Mycobacterium yunnanensis TaxID=368477 RepID=A0A9X2ZAC4_9MYCO|nr:GNAT family N-acetyltransferase [Mycobacterium yunnanensis]MCV7424846.1 GNAT family N-acetyltransferase [Mycobacterium yunnanensis]